MPKKRSCVILACYLPDESKDYVLADILERVQAGLGVVDVYVGVQYGSHPRTEEILQSLAPELRVAARRVPQRLYIDSDACSYVAALAELKSANRSYDVCYFVHTKGITSGDDALRGSLLDILFDRERVERELSRPGVGSFGPHLTITRAASDVQKMRCWRRFLPAGTRLVRPLPYFYAHTVWACRGDLVNQFLSLVDTQFFDTPVSEYSDRYFAERDLPHFVDALGRRAPSFHRLAGNHSTAYARTRRREYLVKLAMWRATTALRRAG